MDSIHIVILVGFIMTWFLIKMLSDQVRKSRDITMTGMLAASKYLDTKIDKEASKIRQYTKIDIVNEIIEYLKLSTYEETDSIKVDYIRKGLQDYLNKHKEE